MPDTAPFTRKLTANVQPVATAGNDLLTPVGECPFAGTVVGVSYIPTAAQAGANTNSRTLNLYNRGTAGTGTALVATLALVSGVNLVDNDEKTIPLSGTAGNLQVADGDVLEWESLHVGTGIADPGGDVQVELQENYA
jgi:hypothetical protein